MLRALTRFGIPFLLTAALLTACAAGASGDPWGTEASPGPSPTWTPSGSVDLSDPEQYAAALEEGVNAARAQRDVPPVEHDDCLAAVAVERAGELIGAPKLVHAPLEPVQESCPGAFAAENLSRTTNPPQDVVQAWLDSPSHRENLVAPDLLRGAIGCVKAGGTTTAPLLTCSHVFLG
ncbi:CAP domain-containing protein [Promicromonospora sp. NPDC023805]|uniref:CAP domain-containing protein n=1 Tax=Promicromonospora sp. NPDC023805 TaxID=3154696 RepID=UPI003411B49A